MPSVRIEDDAFGDLRFDVLAAEAGLADADHARGKMVRLWRQCTAENVHTLPEAVVISVLGERGVSALIVARLGEKTSHGVRIKGTKGRIEWLATLRKNGAKGGRPKVSNPKTRRKPSGSDDPNPLALVTALVTATAQIPESELAPAGQAPPPKPHRQVAPTPPGYAATIAAFHAAYEAQTGRKPTWGAKQGAMVKRLIAAHGADEVQVRIGRLFAGAIAEWCHPPYDLGTLVQHFDKLADVTAPPVAALRPSQQPLKGLAAALAIDPSELQ